MTDPKAPPRDDLYRAIPGAATAEGRTLTIRLAPHETWAEINSVSEGHFMERFSRSAYRKTMAEQKPKIIFQHGKDPEVGDKPIATTTEAGEDATSPYARGELLDGVPALIESGLRAGAYGASHKFGVVREDWVQKPERSDANPEGLPERTITEARLYELGPVTWPAYASATAALRSLTDEMRGITPPEPVAPSVDAEAETPHLEPERRDEPETRLVAGPEAVVIAVDEPNRSAPVAIDISQFRTLEDMLARVHELNAEIKRAADLPGILPEVEQKAFDEKVADRAALEAAVTAWRGRIAQVREASAEPNGSEVGVAPPYTPPSIIKTRDEASIYDVRRIERDARNDDQRVVALRDATMRSVEGAAFAATERATSQGQVEALLKGKDYVDPEIMAKRVLHTGSPAYRRAYRKYLTQGAAGPAFTPEEADAFEETRTALVTASNVAVPYDLDTTIAINTSGAINPARQVFRNVQTTSNDWRPMVSSGMTAVYEDEATAATDLSPSFTAPARLLVKAHTAATFSVEIQGDFARGGGLEAELSREISDAKDVLEATQFMTGAGSTHFPNGLFTYYTANFLDTTTTLVIVPADLYKLEANIGPRHRGNTVWMGSPYFYSLVRAIDTAGGAGIWVDNLTQGNFGSLENNGLRGSLIGHPAYECVAPANSSMATTEKVAILADRDRFVIIDRVGMNIELIPNFVDTTTGYPTGQRMVYAWWRNTSVGIGLATLGAGRSSCIFRGK